MFHDHTLWTLFAISFFAAFSAPLSATAPLHQPITALIDAQPHAARGLGLIGDDRLAVAHCSGNVGVYQMSKANQQDG